MNTKKFHDAALAFLLLLLGIYLTCCTTLKNVTKSAPLVEVSKSSSYWDSQKKGANFFNEIESSARLNEAAKLGLNWIRLTPSKWKSNRPGAQKGDFLIGSRAAYDGLVKEDAAHLRRVLDAAEKAQIKVVLTFLDLPGHYWLQHNNGVQDRRLWQNKSFWPAAIAFLGDVVTEFKGHPALVGYDLLNEPSPEKATNGFPDWVDGDYVKWSKKITDSAQDFNQFYAQAISAIRRVDSQVPIIIETSYYATPWAISALQPVNDNNVLYSVHMYEPFLFTFQHRGEKNKYEYPGAIPIGEIEKNRKILTWNKEQLKEFFRPLREWQKEHHIPSNRIVIGEFGVNRFAKNAPQYLKDLIELFDDHQWHWAFYSFREDSWQVMDYELGQKKATYRYWQAISNKNMPDYPQEKNLFLDAIRKSLGTIPVASASTK